MTLNEKKSVILSFLHNCNRYADGKLAEYKARLEQASDQEALGLQDKVGHWTAYRAFNCHAIEELAGDTLDGWLEDPTPR